MGVEGRERTWAWFAGVSVWTDLTSVPTWRGGHTPLNLPPPDASCLHLSPAHSSGLICPIYVDPPTRIYMDTPSVKRFLCGCQKILFYLS